MITSIKRSILAAATATACLSALADPITYQVNLSGPGVFIAEGSYAPIGGVDYSLVGTITTDGKLGSLTSADIESWSFSANYHGTTQTQSSTDAGSALIIDGVLSASPTSLGVSGDFETTVDYNGTLKQLAFNAEYNNILMESSDGDAEVGDYSDGESSSDFAAVSSVPEPSTYASVVLGLLTIGGLQAARRRRTARV